MLVEEASPAGFHHIPASRTCIPLSTFFLYQREGEQKLSLHKGQQVSQLAATVPKDSLPQSMISLRTFNRKWQAQSRCVPQNQKKERRWKLEKKDNRIRRVSSNEHNGIQSYSGTRAGNVLHMSPSSICSRPATEQAHIAAETASLGILSHQQGHTQHNPLPLSFKLPKQAFPPLEACISSKTSPNQKLFWKSDTNIYNLHQSPASVATALERDCCPFPHLYSKVCESCTQIMRKA